MRVSLLIAPVRASSFRKCTPNLGCLPVCKALCAQGWCGNKTLLSPRRQAIGTECAPASPESEPERLPIGLTAHPSQKVCAKRRDVSESFVDHDTEVLHHQSGNASASYASSASLLIGHVTHSDSPNIRRHVKSQDESQFVLKPFCKLGGLSYFGNMVRLCSCCARTHRVAANCCIQRHSSISV